MRGASGKRRNGGVQEIESSHDRHQRRHGSHARRIVGVQVDGHANRRFEALDQTVGILRQMDENIRQDVGNDDFCFNINATKQVACRVRLAIATLRRHESEENELLQRVYCDSIGAGD